MAKATCCSNCGKFWQVEELEWRICDHGLFCGMCLAIPKIKDHKCTPEASKLSTLLPTQ